MSAMASHDRLFKHRWKKTSKLCVTGLCAGNSPVASELPAQKASNAENVSIWWRHHVMTGKDISYPVPLIHLIFQLTNYLQQNHYKRAQQVHCILCISFRTPQVTDILLHSYLSFMCSIVLMIYHSMWCMNMSRKISVNNKPHQVRSNIYIYICTYSDLFMQTLNKSSVTRIHHIRKPKKYPSGKPKKIGLIPDDIHNISHLMCFIMFCFGFYFLLFSVD